MGTMYKVPKELELVQAPFKPAFLKSCHLLYPEIALTQPQGPSDQSKCTLPQGTSMPVCLGHPGSPRKEKG